MNLIKRFSKLFSLFLLLVVVLTSCIEEANRYRPIEPGTSPLDYLNPSTDFSWNTMESASVTIEVDDKFNSEYDYIVHVYSYHPLSVDEPSALFSGVARGNAPLTCQLSFPSKMTNIYVEMIDPQGYSTVYGYEAPDAGTSVTFPCRVGVPAYETTRFVQTRTDVSAADVDFTIPVPADFLPFNLTVPDEVSSLPDNSIWGQDVVYVVPEGETVKLNNNNSYKSASNGQLRILVSGTLEIKDVLLYNGAQIYILPGGKLEGAQVTLLEDALLYIAEGASAKLQYVSTSGSNALLYAGGDTEITHTISFNNSGSNIYVAPTGRVYGDAAVDYIQGDIYVDADENSSGEFSSKNITATNTTVRLIVAPNAKMEIKNDVIFYGKIYNGGLFSAKKIFGNNGPEPKIYNACTLIASEEISDIGNMYLKHGTVSGGVSENNGELTFTAMNFYAPSFTHNIYMLDGSYIYVKKAEFGQGAAYGLNNEGNSETSLISCANKLESSNTYYLHGNIAYEAKHTPKNMRMDNGVVSADLEQLQLNLNTCTGAIVTRPDDPTEPSQEDTYVASLQAAYTVNFEDQWPVLGDYDLNDIVLHVSRIDTRQTGNHLKEAKFTFTLLAVGATYTLGMGLEFLDVTNNQIESVVSDIEGMAGHEESDIYTAFHLDAKGLDIGEDNETAIVPLFYNAHKVLLNQNDLPWSERPILNTGGTTVPAKTFTLTITFVDGAHVSPEALLSSSLNFFIYRVVDTYNGRRVEIHLKNYPPTRNSTYTPFLTDEIKALPDGTYYVNENGFPWGILISDVNEPTEPWSWPDDMVLISTVYSDFDLWVKSNGKSNKNWMDKK